MPRLMLTCCIIPYPFDYAKKHNHAVYGRLEMITRLIPSRLYETKKTQ